MKKIILWIVAPGLIVLAVYAFSPLFFDREVSEDIGEIGTEIEKTEEDLDIQNQSSITQIKTISSGQFVGIGVHSGKGIAKVLENGGEYFVRLEDDFEVTNGPDLYVYLGRDGKYDPQAEIGRLKGNVGSQNYQIPRNIDHTKYNEVWVWCKQFSVEFAKAELKT